MSRMGSNYCVSVIMGFAGKKGKKKKEVPFLSLVMMNVYSESHKWKNNSEFFLLGTHFLVSIYIHTKMCSLQFQHIIRQSKR